MKVHGPISFQFHMQPSSKGGEKVYIFCPGHKTKMAAMPIYGKNLTKSSPEPLRGLPPVQTYFIAFVQLKVQTMGLGYKFSQH